MTLDVAVLAARLAGADPREARRCESRQPVTDRAVADPGRHGGRAVMGVAVTGGATGEPGVGAPIAGAVTRGTTHRPVAALERVAGSRVIEAPRGPFGKPRGDMAVGTGRPQPPLVPVPMTPRSL